MRESTFHARPNSRLHAVATHAVLPYTQRRQHGITTHVLNGKRIATGPRHGIRTRQDGPPNPSRRASRHRMRLCTSFLHAESSQTFDVGLACTGLWHRKVTLMYDVRCCAGMWRASYPCVGGSLLCVFCVFVLHVNLSTFRATPSLQAPSDVGRSKAQRQDISPQGAFVPVAAQQSRCFPQSDLSSALFLTRLEDGSRTMVGISTCLR